ncbi:hypothetical protein Mapa_001421 [Marchantia paleacea]|nr:hypothetical protein Mapa_001421 [Marchantia paleacea]
MNVLEHVVPPSVSCRAAARGFDSLFAHRVSGQVEVIYDHYYCCWTKVDAGFIHASHLHGWAQTKGKPKFKGHKIEKSKHVFRVNIPISFRNIICLL